METTKHGRGRPLGSKELKARRIKLQIYTTERVANYLKSLAEQSGLNITTQAHVVLNDLVNRHQFMDLPNAEG
jgi:imidazoleglycerol phosphate dehydratase HisB